MVRILAPAFVVAFVVGFLASLRFCFVSPPCPRRGWRMEGPAACGTRGPQLTRVLG